MKPSPEIEMDRVEMKRKEKSCRTKVKTLYNYKTWRVLEGEGEGDTVEIVYKKERKKERELS